MILIIIGDADISFFFLVYRQTDRQTEHQYFTDSHTQQSGTMYWYTPTYLDTHSTNMSRKK